MTALPETLAATGAAAAARAVAPGLGDVLRRTPFTLLVAGQTLSQLGDKLHHMALIALVGAGASAQTGGLELAKLSLVFTAPVLLFGPLIGATVDGWNKRLTMIACDTLRGALVLSIPALYHATGHLWTVYAVAFFVFLLGIIFNSAKMALIPELVARDELLPANAALAFIGRFATVGGIVGGGLIIGAPIWKRFGWSDYAAGFYLDGASYFISVIALLGILAVHETRQGRADRGSGSAGRGRVAPPVAGRIATTLAVVARHPELRFVFFTLVLLAMFAATAYVAMTLSVQTVLGRGTAGVGYLGGMLAGGMIVGSLLVGTLGVRVRKEVLILVCIAGIGVLLALGGVFFSFRVFAPVAVLGGVLLAPVMVAQDTLLHEHAPADSRALVFSTRDVIVGGVFVVSAFLVGGGVYVAGRLGAAEPYRLVLVVSGVLIAVAATVGGAAALKGLHAQRARGRTAT